MSTNDYGMPPGYTTPPGVPPTAPPVKKRGKGKQPKAPNRKSSSLSKWLAIVLAGLAGLFVVMFLTSSSQQTFVVRASAGLPALASVAQENLEAVPLPESAIEPDTFTGSSAEEAFAAATAFAAGKWLVYPIGQGQQLRTDDFSNVGELAVPLAPNERLISVSAQAAKSVAGGVRPGDRVDLYAASTQGTAGLLAEDIEVVGVTISPQEFESLAQAQISDKEVTLQDSVPAEPIPGTYVLRVLAEDVSRFVVADAEGTLYLALRAAGGVSVPATGPITLEQALCKPGSPLDSCGGAAPSASAGPVAQPEVSPMPAVPAEATDSTTTPAPVPSPSN